MSDESLSLPANSLIDELLSEKNEALEDRRKTFRWQQCLHAIGGMSRLFWLIVGLFFWAWGVLCVLLLIFGGESSIELLRQASSQSIYELVQTVSILSVVISLLTAFAYVGLKTKRYFRNAREEWFEAEQRHIDDLKNIVLITEELLRRHRLIESENKEAS